MLQKCYSLCVIGYPWSLSSPAESWVWQPVSIVIPPRGMNGLKYTEPTRWPLGLLKGKENVEILGVNHTEGHLGCGVISRACLQGRGMGITPSGNEAAGLPMSQHPSGWGDPDWLGQYIQKFWLAGFCLYRCQTMDSPSTHCSCLLAQLPFIEFIFSPQGLAQFLFY